MKRHLAEARQVSFARGGVSVLEYPRVGLPQGSSQSAWSNVGLPGPGIFSDAILKLIQEVFK